jgi:hypothetical protein
MHFPLKADGLTLKTIASRTATAAIVGGTATAIIGGDFANGAKTAAYAQLYNDIADKIQNAADALDTLGNEMMPLEGAGELPKLGAEGLKLADEGLKELPKALKVTKILTSKVERVVGEKITGFTKHGLNQVISRDVGRGVSGKAVLDAIRNPINIIDQSGGVLKYIGSRATVITNRFGKIITAYGEPRW